METSNGGNRDERLKDYIAKVMKFAREMNNLNPSDELEEVIYHLDRALIWQKAIVQRIEDEKFFRNRRKKNGTEPF